MGKPMHLRQLPLAVLVLFGAVFPSGSAKKNQVSDCPAGTARLYAEVDRTSSSDSGNGLLDSNFDTPWISNPATNKDEMEDFVLSLGAKQQVTSVLLAWDKLQHYRPAAFIVQGKKKDSDKWKTYYSTNTTDDCSRRELDADNSTDTPSAVVECVATLSVTWRELKFLRVRGTAAKSSGKNNPYILYDVGVCGPISMPSSCANTASNLAVSAAAYSSAEDVGEGAVDGDVLTMWRSTPVSADDGVEQWLAVDLDNDQSIDSVVTVWPVEYETHPRRYQLQSRRGEAAGGWNTHVTVQMHSSSGGLPSSFGYGTICGTVNRTNGQYFECSTDVRPYNIKARHLRLFVKSTHDLMTEGFSYVLYELEVCGDVALFPPPRSPSPPTPPPLCAINAALNQTTKSSNGDNDGGGLVDGSNPPVVWESRPITESAQNEWLMVGLDFKRQLHTSTVEVAVAGSC